MRLFSTTVCALVLVGFTVLPGFAESVRMVPLAVPSAASNGFGGHNTAFTDNVFSLLVNPAALVRTQQASVFVLAPSLYNPESAFLITPYISDLISEGNFSHLKNIADVFSRGKGKVVLGLELREFPFALAWVSSGIGVGMWSRTFVRSEIIGNSAAAVAYSDFIIPVGFAFKVLDVYSHSVDAGFSVKPFIRIRAEQQEFITDLIDSIDSGDYEFKAAIPVIAGGSFDVGFLYRWEGGFQAALTFTNIRSRGTVIANLGSIDDTNSYYIPFAVNAGLAHSIRLTPSAIFTMVTDWRDIGNVFNQDDYLNSGNYLLDFGFGVQFDFFSTFFLRMGINQMLPAAGFGFHFGALEIDIAYYGQEFGYEPGQLPAAALDLSIAIRPRLQQRDWPWTRSSVLGLFGVGRK